MPIREKLVRHKVKIAENARLSGGAAPSEAVEGSGEPNRHGMPKVPPGQHPVVKWPILDLGIRPEVPTRHWKLTVGGAVLRPYTLSWDGLSELAQVEEESDFHCVTTWSRMDMRFGGVRFRALAERAGLKPAARFVFFTAYDGYTTNLRLEEAMDEDVLLVTTWDGAPLPREHGGPARIVVPKKYAWKGAKWVKEIAFLEEDRKGFWEVRGYSNTAEPWYNDRYAG